jgi:chaperone required for assembly of F1-ATPase
MRRFWTEARAVESTSGFHILLDQRPLRLPEGTPLVITSAALAEAIAEEWQKAGQDGAEFSFAQLPFTRLAGTAQLRIAPDPAPTIAALAKYGESDLLCYRAEAPAALVERQAAQWQPWLDWAAIHLDAQLRVTTGVVPIVQPQQSVAALRFALTQYSAEMLAALGVAVPALGSLVLGLAMAAGALDAAQATALSQLDELFQAEFWGEDAEARTRRRLLGQDVSEAERFMILVGRR